MNYIIFFCFRSRCVHPSFPCSPSPSHSPISCKYILYIAPPPNLILPHPSLRSISYFVPINAAKGTHLSVQPGPSGRSCYYYYYDNWKQSSNLSHRRAPVRDLLRYKHTYMIQYDKLKRKIVDSLREKWTYNLTNANSLETLSFN